MLTSDLFFSASVFLAPDAPNRTSIFPSSKWSVTINGSLFTVSVRSSGKRKWRKDEKSDLWIKTDLNHKQPGHFIKTISVITNAVSLVSKAQELDSGIFHDLLLQFASFHE